MMVWTDNRSSDSPALPVMRSTWNASRTIRLTTMRLRSGVSFATDAPDKPSLAQQLGYVSQELAEDLAPRMDKHGHVLMARILTVTESEDGNIVGVNIQIEEYKPAKTIPRHAFRAHLASSF